MSLLQSLDLGKDLFLKISELGAQIRGGAAVQNARAAVGSFFDDVRDFIGHGADQLVHVPGFCKQIQIMSCIDIEQFSMDTWQPMKTCLNVLHEAQQFSEEKSVLAVQSGDLQPRPDHGTFTLLDGKRQPFDGLKREANRSASLQISLLRKLAAGERSAHHDHHTFNNGIIYHDFKIQRR
jgi:hypothetical protein